MNPTLLLPCCSGGSRYLQALAAAHWQAVQAAEDTSGGSLSQEGSSRLTEACGKGVIALAYLPSWCPQVVDSAYLALVRLKLSCQAAVSRLLASNSHVAELCSPRHIWMDRRPADGCSSCTVPASLPLSMSQAAHAPCRAPLRKMQQSTTSTRGWSPLPLQAHHCIKQAQGCLRQGWPAAGSWP